MAHLCYNDIGTIKSALSSLIEHKESLAEILNDTRTRDYLLKERDEAVRLRKFFDEIGNRLLDLDLGKSVLIKASWYKQN